MTTKELCKQNYGRTWSAEMLAKLVGKGKLTEVEYQEITGTVYVGEPYIPSERVVQLETQLSQTDDVLIELYEGQLSLQSQTDSALIELFEMMEGGV